MKIKEEYKNFFSTLDKYISEKPYCVEHRGSPIANVEFRDWLVKKQLENTLFNWFINTDRDLDIEIKTNRTWLDDTKVVLKLLKQGNNVEFIEGCVENKQFRPVNKISYIHVDKLKKEED